MFSECMKLARRRAGITQSDLARTLNVSTGAVGNWESGAREPDAAMMSKIADALGCSVDYLLGRDTEAPVVAEHRSVTDDDIKVALFGGDGEVTEEMWREVKRFAQYVKLTRGK